VLLSIEEQGKRMDIHVTSDLPTAWSGTLRWWLATLSGETLKTGIEPVSLAPLASNKVYSQEFELDDEQTRQVVFICELVHNDQRVDISLSTFVPTKHISLADPRLEVALRPDGNLIEIAVYAKSLARFVELDFDGADVIFSSNYFDIPAGWTQTVTCQLPSGWTLGQAAQALTVRSLYDSF
jgi:beta-mannosidase